MTFRSTSCLFADNVEYLTNMLITPPMIVTKIYKKLKNNQSTGIDGITPKEIAEEISVHWKVCLVYLCAREPFHISGSLLI